MAEDDDPYPAWSEAATKGDLIRAVVYLRANLTTLASVIVAMRLNNEPEVQERMGLYFEGSKNLDRVMSDIAGRGRDGE